MTQILVLMVAFAGVIMRIRAHKMSACEWWLVFFVGLNIFLVQLQMFVGESGKLVWILRYHQTALTLLYGWAAWAVVELIKSSKRLLRKSIIIFVILWLIGAGGTSMWRIVKHAFVESRRNAQMLAAQWATELIDEDWQGPKIDKEHYFTIQEYHPRRRPIIHSDGAYLSNICKGRLYFRVPDIRRHEKPDYAFLPKGVKAPPGMTLLAEKSFGRKKRVFCIYRSTKGEK